jgi:hypothetical protein
MVLLAIDAPTIASLATALGTLVLAVATFASVRSANRSARIAEIALQEQRRPLLAPSRIEDPAQKIMFVEGHWVRAEGSRGVAQYEHGNIYLALSLRNVGSGIAVCQGWTVNAGMMTIRAAPRASPLDSFRAQTRDLFIAAGDIGMWQGAIRSHDDPGYDALVDAIENRQPISIELLYSDQVGGQRTVSRFGLTAWPDETWFVAGNRHWFLDGPTPRDEAALLARAEEILREQAAQGEHPPDEFPRPAATRGAEPDYSSSSES